MSRSPVVDHDRSPVVDRSPVDDDVQDLQRRIEEKDSAIVTMRVHRVVEQSKVGALRRELRQIRNELALAVDTQDWTVIEDIIARLS